MVSCGLAMIIDRHSQVNSKLKTSKDDLSWCEMHIRLKANKNKWELSSKVNT
jgi:hypothetical protein